MDSIRRICSNIGYHDEGRYRDKAFALSALYSALRSDQVSVVRAVRRLGPLITRKPSTASIVINICKFFGDNFNNYVGEFTPEALAAKEIHLGTQPSSIVLEALTHENEAFNAGINYPETLNIAQELGILDKKTFFAFANLSAKVAQEEQVLAIKLKNTPEQNQYERSKIREEMVSANIDFLVVANCLASHILEPNQEIASTDIIDMSMLRRIYPEQLDIAKGIILTYSNVACVNRILREQTDERTEQDAVIAILERDGHYTTELKDQVSEIAARHVHRKTIPIAELPEALQHAIDENQRRIMAGIDRIDKRLHKTLCRTLSKVHILGGTANRIARILAFEAGALTTAPRRF